MWAIENQTPYEVERTFVRDRDGSEIWLVAVRATFSIQSDGRVHVADKQDPVVRAAQYLGKPGLSSLRCDSDLIRTKLGTDVLLNGTAYVPGGKESAEIGVGLRVASLKKSLVISGEQEWMQANGKHVPGPIKPFTKIPITYERSFGGNGTKETPVSMIPFADRNPIGVGVDDTEGAPLPSVRYPGKQAESPSLDKSPAGFGAVPCSWMPRRSLAGTYDEKWQNERQPLLPDDFRDEYFYSAPADQRVDGYLRGGEQVELVNLTPSGYMAFVLPKVSFGFRTSIDGGLSHHRGNLHTVLIEPDDHRLIMVWHSSLPCHHTLYTLKRTVVFVKQEQESLVA